MTSSMVTQLLSIDRSRLGRRMGALSPEHMAMVEPAIAVSLGLA